MAHSAVSGSLYKLLKYSNTRPWFVGVSTPARPATYAVSVAYYLLYSKTSILLTSPDFARFHETALKNASSILKAAGKVKGISVDPYSVQGF